MILQRRDQDLARQVEEPLLESAGYRHGPFHQCGDLVQQGGVDECPTAEAGRFLFHLEADALPTRLKVGNHFAASQEQPVIAGRGGDADGLRGHEAVAAGDLAGIGVQHSRGQCLAPKQQDEPVHGADEFRLARTPAHALRDGQCGQCRSHESGQQIGRRSAGTHAAVGQVFGPFGIGLALQFVELDTAGGGEGGGRARRLTGRIEGGTDGRTTALQLLIGLLFHETADPDGQTPWGRKRFQLAVFEA